MRAYVPGSSVIRCPAIEGGLPRFAGPKNRAIGEWRGEDFRAPVSDAARMPLFLTGVRDLRCSLEIGMEWMILMSGGMDLMNDKYRIIGPLYDIVARIYSAGRIDKCKTAMHDHIRPDDYVLFAGVGQGTDAVAAAERGARVTVVDLSDSMLDIFAGRISGRHFLHPVETVHTDILKYEEYGKFDMVYANFFLNVFTRPMVLAVIEHLAKLAKPGGYVVIGDFALPSGGAVARAFQSLYWYIADIFFVFAARNAFHPVYDYQTMLKGHGFQIEKVRCFRFLFDDRFCSILARKG